MSDPSRLRDDGRGEAGRLLRSARRPRPMPAEVRERSALRVQRLAVVPVAVGAWFWLKGVALAAGVVTAILVARELTRAPSPALLPQQSAAPTSSHRPSPAASAPPAPLASAAPAASQPPSAPAASLAAASPSASPPRPPSSGRAAASVSQPSAALAEGPTPASSPALAEAPAPPAPTASGPPPAAEASAPAAASSRPADDLLAEVALLEAARRSLGQNPAEALALLGDHAARFPRGRMGMERELMTVDALRRLGRTAEARAKGEELLSRVRGGIYEKRIQALLDQLR